jgi:hypothetical protein
MVITSKNSGDQEDRQVSMVVSRSMTMEPASEVNLTRFLADYNKSGAHLVMPVIVGPGQ